MSLIIRILLFVAAIGVAHCRGVGPPQMNQLDEDNDVVIMDDDDDDSEDDPSDDEDGDSDEVSSES
jgi:hypothetical protein